MDKNIYNNNILKLLFLDTFTNANSINNCISIEQIHYEI